MRRFSSTLLSLKMPASFRAEHDPFPGPVARFQVHDVLAHEGDPSQHRDPLPSGHLFFFLDILHDAGKGVHEGGLAGAVGAENPHDLVFLAPDADVVEGQHVFVKDHQAVGFKHGS